jgi:hypothetical protein
MGADARDIVYHTLRLVRNGQPLDVLAGSRARSLTNVLPLPADQGRGVEALRQKASNDFIGEEFHAALGVMDHEPFARP